MHACLRRIMEARRAQKEALVYAHKREGLQPATPIPVLTIGRTIFTMFFFWHSFQMASDIYNSEGTVQLYYPLVHRTR